MRAADSPETAQAKATRQAAALAALTVEEAEQCLDLDWSSPVRHQNFYKAVFRPAVLRAGTVPSALEFHALRHTYASLCVAAGIPPLEIARFMGHAKVTTTLSVCAHLFEDDHTDAMHAPGRYGHALHRRERGAVERSGERVTLREQVVGPERRRMDQRYST